MKRILTIAMVAVMSVATVQASLWDTIGDVEDFSSATINYKAGGDLYPNATELNYGAWAAVAAASVTIDGSDRLALLGHENGSMRSAATRIAGSTFGSLTDLTLEFDIDVAAHANTIAFVEIWEAKSGPDLYYVDSMVSGANPPLIKSWGTAYFQQLASATYVNVTEGTDLQIDFTRIDTSADLVIMFGNSKTVTWWNGSLVDNVSVIPEPATFGLMGLTGLGLMVARRRFEK